MNERIRELAKQSGLVLAGDWGMKRWEGPRSESISDKDLEKFAMSIVRECLGIVNRKEYSYHEADPLWETAQLIKEHFGVEE